MITAVCIARARFATEETFKWAMQRKAGSVHFRFTATQGPHECQTWKTCPGPVASGSGKSDNSGNAAAGHGPGLCHGANASAGDPASLDLRFSPGALGDAQLPETRFRRKSSPQEKISRAPGCPPEKHHEHRFAQHPLSRIQRADVRFFWGCLRQK